MGLAQTSSVVLGVDSSWVLSYTLFIKERYSMKERRKTKRRYLLYYARILDPGSLHQVGNLIDITTRGLMTLSPDPFIIGETIRLRVELSDDVADQPHMDLNVLSLWSHPDIDPSLFNTGFEIVDLGNQEKKIIQRIISIYGFRDNIIPNGTQ
jgi:hypothetical protein